MGNPRRTIKQLRDELSDDLRSFATQLNSNLRATTPIRTGRARGGWQNSYNGTLGTGRTKIAENNVPYIGVLDTGTSRQAPRGIVKIAVDRTRKP